MSCSVGTVQYHNYSTECFFCCLLIWDNMLKTSGVKLVCRYRATLRRQTHTALLQHLSYTHVGLEFTALGLLTDAVFGMVVNVDYK